MSELACRDCGGTDGPFITSDRRTRCERCDQDRTAAADDIVRRLLVIHLAGALLLGDDEEHARAILTAKRLDEAGVNLDDEIDSYIAGHFEQSPRRVWAKPSLRKGLKDPWDEPPF